MQVRKANIDDIKNNREIIINYFFKLLSEDTDIENVSFKTEENYKNMEKFMLDGSANIFCAFENDKIVGFIWAYEIRKKVFHINYFYVEEKFRSMGLGQCLLEKLYKEARAKKIESIELLVNKGNEKALKKYLKNGFKEEQIKMRKIL